MADPEQFPKADDILYGVFRPSDRGETSEDDQSSVKGVSSTPPAIKATPDPKREQAARQRAAALALTGVVLIGFALGLWLAGGDPGSSTTAVATTGATGQAAGGSGLETETEKTTTVSGAGGPSQTTESSREIKGASTTTTISDPGPDGTRSAELSIALIGLGVGLLVVSAFFNRIAKITFPGGLAVELTPQQVARMVAPMLRADPAQAEEREVVARQVVQTIQACAPSDYVEVPKAFVDKTVALTRDLIENR